MALLQQMFEYLESTGTVPENYKPHPLKGNYIDTIECHIKPDWLLFWRIDESTKQIELVGTGTHSDFF
ncbi:MAG TPA: type II toxin-antitoxin system mRNA interferase toxin, RelE/StbE family [Flavobacterium sp.]|nr:type II toxin-antitoxin system mRNA interferase toxin, RelE/StbE family [Flavobacterium sp.]